jgi:hypothetical protein
LLSSADTIITFRGLNVYSTKVPIFGVVRRYVNFT